jgi:hypothetical protein
LSGKEKRTFHWLSMQAKNQNHFLQVDSYNYKLSSSKRRASRRRRSITKI